VNAWIRQHNPVARRLYEKVGFTLYREMRSFKTVP
jgi:predicted GNAT family acetyltransferase